MKFKADHDFHIHSNLSLCADPAQTSESILKYATENGYKKICLTNHFWDEDIPRDFEWYNKQDYAHICEALPLPQSDKVKFYFGCETEMDKDFTVGILPEHYDRFDFIIIPTTHLHMKNFTIAEKNMNFSDRTRLYAERLEHLLEMNLPENKVGIAHLTCSLISNDPWDEHIKVIQNIPDSEFESIFKKAQEKKLGIELNIEVMNYSEKQKEIIFRPYEIAKDCGCKFYLGSDAHQLEHREFAPQKFKIMIDYLKLDEKDKFMPF